MFRLNVGGSPAKAASARAGTECWGREAGGGCAPGPGSGMTQPWTPPLLAAPGCSCTGCLGAWHRASLFAELGAVCRACHPGCHHLESVALFVIWESGFYLRSSARQEAVLLLFVVVSTEGMPLGFFCLLSPSVLTPLSLDVQSRSLSHALSAAPAPHPIWVRALHSWSYGVCTVPPQWEPPLCSLEPHHGSAVACVRVCRAS